MGEVIELRREPADELRVIARRVLREDGCPEEDLEDEVEHLLSTPLSLHTYAGPDGIFGED